MLKNPNIAEWLGDWTVKDGQGVWQRGQEMSSKKDTCWCMSNS